MKISPVSLRWTVFLCLALSLVMGLSAQTQIPPISITVLFDEYPFKKGLKTGQGFACLIQGTEKNILFDTGGQDSAALFGNFAALKIDPLEVELVVISDDDPGSVGGLLPFLAKKGACQVFLPASFSPGLVKQVEAARGTVVLVTNPVSVCEGVYSTGEMAGEQALVVDTPKGLVILAGCAHSGIASVVEKAKSVMPKDIYLLMGGFHLADQSEGAIAPIARKLRELGVKNVGPTHCTGSKAIEILKKEFRENCLPMGVGKMIEIH